MSALVGHIRNPFATRSAASPALGSHNVMTRAPDGMDALAADLRDMAARDIRTLIIDGGDGTVREVVSRAPDIWGEEGREAPRYAILPHGNTNLVARSAGQLNANDVGRLITSPDGFRKASLTMMRVERQGHEPINGFIMGAGAYETATRIAQRDLAARHGWQVILAVLNLVRNRDLRQPTVIGMGLNDDEPVSCQRTLIGISTLPGSLLYGLQPFWGGGQGPLRWLDIAASPRKLWLAAPFIAWGRPRKWMQNDYRSGRANRISLRLTTPFVLDGEAFDAGDDGIVTVSATEAATFLSSP